MKIGDRVIVTPYCRKFFPDIPTSPGLVTKVRVGSDQINHGVIQVEWDNVEEHFTYYGHEKWLRVVRDSDERKR